MRATLTFLDREGTFRLAGAERTHSLYFPLANDAGMMSSITQDLQGDAKTGLHTFLMVPVTVEDLQNARYGRNFWVILDGAEPWSATGNSAGQRVQKLSDDPDEEVDLEAGFLWQKVRRTNKRSRMKAEILSFVPSGQSTVELMQVDITNLGPNARRIIAIAAVPIFGRSADNVRDHRHVTSLLHRISTTTHGIVVTPTLSFDERGHTQNRTSYGVLGSDDRENPPVGFYPLVEDFIGDGGSLDWPAAVVAGGGRENTVGKVCGGNEALGGLRFEEVMLNAGETASYRVALSISDSDKVDQVLRLLTKKEFATAFETTKRSWHARLTNLWFGTGNPEFNAWLRWVAVQPILRRIFGNSFLPYHDYGRGGRGWRDLWQDCLALLLMEPQTVSELLCNNFAGVRIDGSNATVVGKRAGEFIADRNNIPRVWMDHGVWPLLTVRLYLDQTGDLSFLLREQVYFKDRHIRRCKGHDEAWNPADGTVLRTSTGTEYRGSLLEHLLIQNLTSFFNVGEHNNILLEGGDWNDGLDMARDRGESVAFSGMYGSNLMQLAGLLQALGSRLGVRDIELAEEVMVLLDTLDQKVNYDAAEAKQRLLKAYFDRCSPSISGRKTTIAIDDLRKDLEAKGTWILNHVRENEWIAGSGQSGWFNGYYDNDGRRLEGLQDGHVRMTLTAQVFAVMSGVATDSHIPEILRSTNSSLWDESVGGYRLNSDFGSVLMNMGRSFGFAFGNKENGAMFSHMDIMYAYALYSRGYAREGWRILERLYRHCADFDKSRIYPGIPEYIDPHGRGVYTYLTGSASWYLLVMLTRVFGVQGVLGDLHIKPMLCADHFDEHGESTVHTMFADRVLDIRYTNPQRKNFPEYRIAGVAVDGKPVSFKDRDGGILIAREILQRLDPARNHSLVVELN